jgi:ATP-binding cassette, subfamily C, bacterial
MVSRILALARYVLRLTRGQAAFALIFLILGSLTEGVSILLLIPMLQLAGATDGGPVKPVPIVSAILGRDTRLELVPLLVVFVAFVCAQALFAKFKTIYMAEMMQVAVDRMRMRLFRAVGLARWRLIARTRGSDLNHALTNDIDRVQGAMFSLLLLTQNMILLIIYAVLAATISIKMTLFAIAIGTTVLLLLYPVRRFSSLYGQQLTSARQEQYRTVSEFITGMKMAKSFNAEPRYLGQLAATLRGVRVQALRYTRLASTGTLLFQVTSTIAIAVFVYIAVSHLHLPVARIAVMVLLFMRVAPRFNDLQDMMQQLLTSIPAFDTLIATIRNCEQERESDAAGGEVLLAPISKAIVFDDVTVRYGVDSTDEVLSNASFEIPAGRITALIGPSGSGKTTIADLVMGLLDPTEGSVTVDGVKLEASNRRGWRNQIAYVPQEVFLLHDTIAANLAIARPEASEEEMWAALDGASAGDFVRRLPDGLKTVVGDRGQRLSGGERQRIALARGLLRAPRLLILDEATSALDWENQMLIARSIEKLRGTMTIITIAHRPSMIAFADWVIAVENGKIIETGNYAALIAAPTSRLHRLVMGEQVYELDSEGKAGRVAD